MERCVSVERCKETGSFILFPMGTFKGYGGYMSINPYRELPPDSSPLLLGQTALDLLALSGPTGVHIKDANSYRESADEESVRIRETYFSHINSTAKRAKRFINVEIWKRDHQKTWILRKYQYDPKLRCSVVNQEERVSLREGVEQLGNMLLSLLNIPGVELRRTRTIRHGTKRPNSRRHGSQEGAD